MFILLGCVVQLSQNQYHIFLESSYTITRSPIQKNIPKKIFQIDKEDENNKHHKIRKKKPPVGIDPGSYGLKSTSLTAVLLK